MKSLSILLSGALMLSSSHSLAATILAKASSVKTLTTNASLVESNRYLTFTKAESGTALYEIVIPSSGVYTLKIKAIARKTTENAVYFSFNSGAKIALDLNISATPVETAYSKGLSLQAGTHKFVLSGKEPFIKIESFTLESQGPIVNPSPSPTPAPSPTVSPSPVDESAAAPGPSQFGNLSANYPITEASSMADAVTKVKSATGGQRIRLPAGTFSNVQMTIQGQGLAGKPVILEGQANGQTVLNGKVKIIVRGSHVLLRNLSFVEADSVDYGGNSALVKFDGCVSCGLHRSSFVGGPAASMSGANDTKHFKTVLISASSQKIEVGFNTFRGKKNAGSVVLINRSQAPAGGVDGNRIYKNHFIDREIAGDDANDFDIIRIGDSGTSQYPAPANAEALLDRNLIVGNIVEFNLFENFTLEKSLMASCKAANSFTLSKCKGEPEVISIKAPQTLVRFNTFLNIMGGITIRHGFQSIVEGNYVVGTNVNNGQTTIAPNSYGIRVIGENHIVASNHFQDLNAASDLLGGISILPGQPNAAPSGYWPVYDSIIAMNFVKNVKTKMISLASDYGGRSKTILPEKIFIGYNVLSSDGAPIINQSTSTSYLSSMAFHQNAADGAAMSGPLASAVTATSRIAVVNLGSGVSMPSSAGFSGNAGLLAGSTVKHQEILSKLSEVTSVNSVNRMKKLMQHLKIKNGSLYSNVTPLTAAQVGVSAP